MAVKDGNYELRMEVIKQGNQAKEVRCNSDYFHARLMQSDALEFTSVSRGTIISSDWPRIRLTLFPKTN